MIVKIYLDRVSNTSQYEESMKSEIIWRQFKMFKQTIKHPMFKLRSPSIQTPTFV